MSGGGGTGPGRTDPIAALNEVLSEVIDLVQDVKQAHRKVPESEGLHAELDSLSSDLRSWAGLLMDRDQALGVSALASIPSVAGRKPPNLWPGAVTEDEVREVVGQHLARLGEHVAAALTGEQDEATRSALAAVERGVHAQSEVIGPSRQ